MKHVEKKTEIVVKRTRSQWRLEREYGYEPCWEEYCFQYLCRRTTTKLLGVVLTLDRVLDHERLPMAALIDLQTVGSTSWKSKFAGSNARFLTKRENNAKPLAIAEK